MSKRKSKICVCGHFAFNQNLLNGQTIKTKIVASFLERTFGKYQVQKVDTHGGVLKFLSLPFTLFSKLKRCENIIILPAQNGLKVISPLLFIENIFFRRKLHYVVIGGWLPDFLSRNPWLDKILKKYHCIYVETQTMKNALTNKGYDNISILCNCKELSIVGNTDLGFHQNEPYSLCTFSRVMKEKGIEDAIDAVKYVNDAFNRVVFTLDIYGQVDTNQEEWFTDISKSFPSFVHYKGQVPFDKTVDVLKEYYALLFPTKFYTEGIPGTIIDAYAAGIPVISAKWESFSDVVDNEITGFGYEFNEPDGLKKILTVVADNPEILNKMKPNCVVKAHKFTPNVAMEVLINNI